MYYYEYSVRFNQLPQRFQKFIKRRQRRFLFEWIRDIAVLFPLSVAVATGIIYFIHGLLF